jgi:hypothetical protein
VIFQRRTIVQTQVSNPDRLPSSLCLVEDLPLISATPIKQGQASDLITKQGPGQRDIISRYLSDLVISIHHALAENYLVFQKQEYAKRDVVFTDLVYQLGDGIKAGNLFSG